MLYIIIIYYLQSVVSSLSMNEKLSLCYSFSILLKYSLVAVAHFCQFPVKFPICPHYGNRVIGSISQAGAGDQLAEEGQIILCRVSNDSNMMSVQY